MRTKRIEEEATRATGWARARQLPIAARQATDLALQRHIPALATTLGLVLAAVLAVGIIMALTGGAPTEEDAGPYVQARGAVDGLRTMLLAAGAVAIAIGAFQVGRALVMWQRGIRARGVGALGTAVTALGGAVFAIALTAAGGPAGVAVAIGATLVLFGR